MCSKEHYPVFGTAESLMWQGNETHRFLLLICLVPFLFRNLSFRYACESRLWPSCSRKLVPGMTSCPFCGRRHRVQRRRSSWRSRLTPSRA